MFYSLIYLPGFVFSYLPNSLLSPVISGYHFIFHSPYLRIFLVFNVVQTNIQNQNVGLEEKGWRMQEDI